MSETREWAAFILLLIIVVEDGILLYYEKAIRDYYKGWFAERASWYARRAKLTGESKPIPSSAKPADTVELVRQAVSREKDGVEAAATKYIDMCQESCDGYGYILTRDGSGNVLGVEAIKREGNKQ